MKDKKKAVFVSPRVHSKLLIKQTSKKIEAGRHITIGEIIEEMLDL